MLVHGLLGVGRAQELVHLEGSRLAFFLRCQQTLVRVSQREAAGSERAEIWQKRADREAWILLACTRRGTFSRSVMCERPVPGRIRWSGREIQLRVAIAARPERR